MGNVKNFLLPDSTWPPAVEPDPMEMREAQVEREIIHTTQGVETLTATLTKDDFDLPNTNLHLMGLIVSYEKLLNKIQTRAA
tara:strand:+ start:2165 stop:2410 length:246 start_codon:yes stop_codon:yes gene_type:complete